MGLVTVGVGDWCNWGLYLEGWLSWLVIVWGIIRVNDGRLCGGKGEGCVQILVVSTGDHQGDRDADGGRWWLYNSLIVY